MYRVVEHNTDGSNIIRNMMGHPEADKLCDDMNSKFRTMHRCYTVERDYEVLPKEEAPISGPLEEVSDILYII